mmetsp:Transcript_47794/g.153690  ORF Transcript_47794/g.153690 Transcript_47794/m.153690 type:complete len:272 (+) Transcript_47794:564-1379(+)
MLSGDRRAPQREARELGPPSPVVEVLLPEDELRGGGALPLAHLALPRRARHPRGHHPLLRSRFVPVRQVALDVPLDVEPRVAQHLKAAVLEPRRVHAVEGRGKDKHGRTGGGGATALGDGDRVNQARAHADERAEGPVEVDGRVQRHRAALAASAEHDALRVAAEQLDLAVEDGVDAAGLRRQVRLVEDVVLVLAVAAGVIVVPGGDVRLGARRPANRSPRRAGKDIFAARQADSSDALRQLHHGVRVLGRRVHAVQQDDGVRVRARRLDD